MIDVAPLEHALGRRQAHLLDVLVDRAVLLDEEIALRHVGLGLVVVVVADEVLDRVLREELAELAVELRRQRLVGREDDRRPADLGDHVGHREGLARAGDAEQRLEREAVADALDQALDRRRLVAGRRIGPKELERRARVRDEFTFRLARRLLRRARLRSSVSWQINFGVGSRRHAEPTRVPQTSRPAGPHRARGPTVGRWRPPRVFQGRRHPGGTFHVFALRRRRDGAPRPDPGSERAVPRRPEPGQGQPRRRRLLRRERQAAAARLHPRGRENDDGSAAGARLPADRRHRRLRRGDPGARLRRRRGAPRRPDRDRPGGRRHRRPQGRRRPAAAHEPDGARPDQRAELGEPPRPVRRRRLRGRHLSLLRPAHQGRRLRGDARRAEPPPRPGRSSSCTPAATTRPAAT